MTNPIYSAPLDLFTTAALTLLRSTGRVVFDSVYSRVPELVSEQAPGYAADPLKPVYPYGILYALTGGSSDATPDLAITRQTVEVAYQVTALSDRRNQCQAIGRLFRDRVTARDRDGFVYGLPDVGGWACTDRYPDPDLPGVDVSGDPPFRVFSQPFRFHLTFSRI